MHLFIKQQQTHISHMYGYQRGNVEGRGKLGDGPGSSVHGILQARVLEWVAISFSRGSSQPRDQAQVSCIAGRRFTVQATWEADIHTTVYKRLMRTYCTAQGAHQFLY